MVVMQCFQVVYREISHEWLKKLSHECDISRYTTRESIAKLIYPMPKDMIGYN